MDHDRINDVLERFSARGEATTNDVEEILAMLISNPKDKERLTSAIKELSNSMTRIDAERDFQKDAVAKVSEDTGVDKAHIKKLASIYHKQTFAKVQSEQEELVDLYEELFGTVD